MEEGKIRVEGSLMVIAPLIIWVAALVFFRIYRIWLPFYVIGSVGLATAIIFFGRTTFPMEEWLKVITGLSVHYTANLLGIHTELFQGVPGALLVLVISQEIGWTILHIDIECSGLLESAVFIGLFAFYPTWSIGKKLGLAFIGLTATFIANVVRMLAIVTILHWGGKDTLFLAHTIVARGLFFGIIVLVYWFILTKPTVSTIKHNLHRGEVG